MLKSLQPNIRPHCARLISGLLGHECSKDNVRRAIAEGLAELDAGNYRDGTKIFREVRDKLLHKLSRENDRSNDVA